MSDPLLFFPDNTVLNNFALTNLMGELEALVGSRGRWCATVADECARGSAVSGLEEMARAATIFGDPWYPEGIERIDVHIIREQMVKPGDARTAHLGEAETIAIMTRRQVRGFFVTDDRDAAREAVRHGIRVVTTWDILRLMVRGGALNLDDFHVHTATLARARRGTPPGWPQRTAINEWLGVTE